ncbi:MAG: YqaA family protein [Pseudomonadota bacterium]|nr:YqaA family protein [Pseudomonadota bacterium]
MNFKKIINLFQSLNSKYILGFVSFIESIFFPIPPDLLLIPMVLSKKFNWLYLAAITTLASVLGGIVGYYLGNLFFNELYVYIVDYGYVSNFDAAKVIFLEYGILILFLSGFTPIPYKVFTITAGFMSVNLLMFIIVSTIGRGLRFYLVAFLSNKYRENINFYLNRYFFQLTVLVLIIFFLFKLYM